MVAASTGREAATAVEDLEDRLRAHDWDFPEADDARTIHGIHPYPAKFISAIPRALIETLGVQPASGVLDPFCGAGTTLAVAQELGYPSVGIDLNPVAGLISRVKTAPAPRGLLDASFRIAALARTGPPVEVPKLPNLDHWFCPAAASAISAIIEGVETEHDENLRDHLRLALSSIIVRVSNQESDTRYAAIEKSISFDAVVDQFFSACARLSEQKKIQQPNAPQARILVKDILAVLAADIPHPISMVVTSPPYPNAYEYWLYHKYRMWWLGWDPLGVRAKEIGARPHYFRQTPATYAAFCEQMSQVLALLYQVVIPMGFICFVVGRSRIHGIDYDNAETIVREGARQGLQLVARIDREIRANRKAFNLSHARIKSEQVVILRRPQ